MIHDRYNTRSVTNLRHMDDNFLFAASPEELQKLVKCVARVTKEENMQINEGNG